VIGSYHSFFRLIYSNFLILLFFVFLYLNIFLNLKLKINIKFFDTLTYLAHQKYFLCKNNKFTFNQSLDILNFFLLLSGQFNFLRLILYQKFVLNIIFIILKITNFLLLILLYLSVNGKRTVSFILQSSVLCLY
jgi:hypothetical protein